MVTTVELDLHFLAIKVFEFFLLLEMPSQGPGEDVSPGITLNLRAFLRA